MARIYGKELCTWKKTKVCSPKGFKSISEKNNEKYFYLNISLQHILISDSVRRVAKIWEWTNDWES